MPVLLNDNNFPFLCITLKIGLNADRSGSKSDFGNFIYQIQAEVITQSKIDKKHTAIHSVRDDI